jgi:hypothetical protein
MFRSDCKYQKGEVYVNSERGRLKAKHVFPSTFNIQYSIHYLQTMTYLFICDYLKEFILGTWGREELMRTLNAVIVSNM